MVSIKKTKDKRFLLTLGDKSWHLSEIEVVGLKKDIQKCLAKKGGK